MVTNEQESLKVYAKERPYVVICFFYIGCETPMYVPLYGWKRDLATRRKWLALSGVVDGNDEWQWDGNGTPVDGNGGAIRRMSAYCDSRCWYRLCDAEPR